MNYEPFRKQDEKAWLSYTDPPTLNPYMAAVLSFAARWAAQMERRLDRGAAIYDIAGQALRHADADNLSDGMFRTAVKILGHVWIYGEELLCWYRNA